MRHGQDEFIYVAPPRNSDAKPLSFRGKFHDGKGTAMQKAVEGERGYGEAIDYRGKPVVAAWSYLPSYRWGMVVKQDDGEAFALIYRQMLVVTALLGRDVSHRDRSAHSGWRERSPGRSATPRS